MNEAGEADVRDVAGRAEYALEIPDCFCTVKGSVNIAQLWSFEILLRFGVDLVKEASAVVLVEDAGEAPWLMLEWLNILNLDKQDITRLRTFDLEWSREIVDSREVDILHIIGRVIVANLSTGPVYTFDLDYFSILDCPIERDVRMPSIVKSWLLPSRLLQVNLESCSDLSRHF